MVMVGDCCFVKNEKKFMLLCNNLSLLINNLNSRFCHGISFRSKPFLFKKVKTLNCLLLFTCFKCSFEVWMFCFESLKLCSYVILLKSLSLILRLTNLSEMRTHIKDWKIRILASKLYFCSTSKQSHFAQKLIKLHLYYNW
jgi:hypothetical protein